MNIKCESIDQNHEFCIDKKTVKELFQNFDIKIVFKKGNVLPYKNAKLLPKKSTKHPVAILFVSKPIVIQLGEFNTIKIPSLNFYSVDKKFLSEALKEQFAQELLPILFNQYNCHKDDDAVLNGCEYSMAVYISDGKFEIEENNKYSF